MKKALVPIGMIVALLALSGVAAHAAAVDTPVLVTAPAPVTTPAPAQTAEVPAAPAGCAPSLDALLQQPAAPAFTPAIQSKPLPAATACAACTIVRGCFSVCPALTEKAPCAITFCCGVETNRICGTCSTHCVPPPA